MDKCWVVIDRIIAVVQFAVAYNVIKTAKDGSIVLNLITFQTSCECTTEIIQEIYTRKHLLTRNQLFNECYIEFLYAKQIPNRRCIRLQTMQPNKSYIPSTWWKKKLQHQK